MSCNIVPITKQRWRWKSIHPVLVPQQIQKMAIKSGLKISNIQWIILQKANIHAELANNELCKHLKWRYNEQQNNLFTMHTKVFNLIQRNGLILRDGFIRRLVSFRIRPESPNLNFPSRNSPSRINHNSQKWLLKLLIKHLSWNINTRKPASIARMRMIPPNSILQTSGLYNKAFFLWITYTTAQYLIERKRTTKSF